jgi:hypothetical protein
VGAVVVINFWYFVHTIHFMSQKVRPFAHSLALLCSDLPTFRRVAHSIALTRVPVALPPQGSLLSPIENARTEMEQITLYRNERNAFLTGGNLFIFLVLRRLVDIQDQLRRARIASKEHDKIEQVIRGSKKNT